MYAIMKAYSWASITVGGMGIGTPEEGPHNFIPLFETREQAVRFADGDETDIVQMEARG